MARRPSAPRDSATMRRLAMPHVIDFIVATRDREASFGGQQLLALHGDVAAARSVLSEFKERYLDLSSGRFAPISVDDLSLLITTSKLFGLLLGQPDAVLSRALGYQQLRQTSEKHLLDRVIYFAVEHVAESMGVPRTVKRSSEMVSAATARLPAIFPTRLLPEHVEKIYSRVRKADPLGYGRPGPPKEPPDS